MLFLLNGCSLQSAGDLALKMSSCKPRYSQVRPPLRKIRTGSLSGVQGGQGGGGDGSSLNLHGEPMVGTMRGEQL